MHDHLVADAAGAGVSLANAPAATRASVVRTFNEVPGNMQGIPLTVSVVAIDFPDGLSQLRGRVRGGTGAVHLHLYVDGELTESWTRAPESFSFDLAGLGSGRHAVTARAIDATGRWGGASVVVAGRG